MKYLLTLYYLLLPITIVAQSIKGVIIDENSAPVPFANVVLVQQGDSSFVAGGVTNERGVFYFTSTIAPMHQLLRVSCIGYQTLYHTIDTLEDISIKLLHQSQELNEIVIKAHRPIFAVNAGVLSANIQNTVLSSLGSASDVLLQLPYINGGEKNLEVIGRGTPAIYINNRLVRNQNELSTLKSDQIKDIKVLLNPSSQFDAQINSVIQITTLRPLNEGFGGSLSLQGKQKKNLVYNGLMDFSYKKGGGDLFLSFYTDIDKWEQKQNDVTTFQYDQQSIRINKDGYLDFQNKLIEISAGGNYMLSPKHSIGVKYTFNKNFETPAYSSFVNLYDDELSSYLFKTSNNSLQADKAHYLNIYYINKFSNDFALNIDATYILKNSNLSEYIRETSDDSLKVVQSRSGANSELYALKGWMSTPIFNGILEWGIEGTYTTNIQDYIMNNKDLSQHLQSNKNRSLNRAISSYFTYSKNWNKLSFEGGIRYEVTGFNYFLNNVKQDKESRTYHNLFPIVALSYKKQESSFNASIHYRSTTQRPSYRQLRSSITYNDRYSYEGGNPTLRASIAQNIGLITSYKNFQLDLSYRFIKDDIMFYSQHFNDKPILLYSFMNHDRSIILANLLYTPIISFWRPSFLLGAYAQSMKFNGNNYNKPLLVYACKNLFVLPHNWMIGFNIDGKSSGNVQFITNRSMINTTAFIKKKFKNIECNIGMKDILNKRRENWTMQIDDIIYDKYNNPDYRSVYIQIVYYFDKPTIKYKGGKSGQSEQGRF